jgi:hypothetical protein
MQEVEEKERKKKRRKIITKRKEGFRRARPALLAVQQVTDVRCN